MADDDARRIRVGTNPQQRQGMLQSPDSMLAPASDYDVDKAVPMGNQFEEQKRSQELKDLSEGLAQWGKAMNEVEMTNDSIQTKRIEADVLASSASIISDLSNNPETRNNPALWNKLYAQRMQEAQDSINEKYSQSFYQNKNRMVAGERANLLVQNERNKVALASADRVSQMASAETAAAVEVAIKSGYYEQAQDIISNNPYLTPAQQTKLQHDLEQKQLVDRIQKKVAEDPFSALKDVNDRGVIDGVALSFEQQEYARNLAQQQINQTQKANYDNLMKHALETPYDLPSIARKAARLWGAGLLTNDMFSHIMRMKNEKTEKPIPTSLDFKADAARMAKASLDYHNASALERAKMEYEARVAYSTKYPAGDVNRLISLMTTKGVSSNDLTRIVGAVKNNWSNQFPLYEINPYLGDDPKRKHPIRLTYDEFKAQLSGGRFFLGDKNDPLAYIDTKTGDWRYPVYERIPNVRNCELRDLIERTAIELYTIKYKTYTSEHEGKQPSAEESARMLHQAVSEAFQSNEITKGTIFTANTIFVEAQEAKEEEQAKAVQPNVSSGGSSENKESQEKKTQEGFYLSVNPSNNQITLLDGEPKKGTSNQVILLQKTLLIPPSTPQERWMTDATAIVESYLGNASPSIKDDVIKSIATFIYNKWCAYEPDKQQ